MANLDTDAALEILVGTDDGQVFALDYDQSSKQLTKLWSHNLTAELGSPTSVRGAISVGDLNGDGQLVAVVPSGNGPSHQGGVVALNAKTGKLIWTYKTYDYFNFTSGQPVPDGITDGVVSTPALGDLNGDGKLEIVFGGFDFRIHVLGPNGKPMSKWPKFIRDTVWSAPAIADIDNDGVNEFVIGIDTHLEGAPFNTPNGGGIYAYHSDGTLLPGFPQFIGQTIYSSIALADLDNNGSTEIIHGTGDFYNNPTEGFRVYVRNAQGAVLWTGATRGYVRDSVAIGDLDGDDKYEVVAVPRNSRAYAWHHNGSGLWDVAPTNFQGINQNILSGFPVLADYDGDGLADVWVNAGWESAVLKGSTGSQFTASTPTANEPTYITNNNTAANAPALGDVTGDGKLDLVLASANSAGTVGQVSLWSLNAPASAANLNWPMFGQNAQHTHYLARPSALNAAPVSNALPEVMLPGQKTTVQVTLRNTGTRIWRASDNIRLGAVGPNDPFAGSATVNLSNGATVEPGQTTTFSITLTAPSTPGYFTTTWRMIDASNGQWFGQGVRQSIKVSNQPALQVLTTQGVYAAGLATTIPAPTGFTVWRAAVAFRLTMDKRAYHLLDSNGGRWPSANTNVLWGAGVRTGLRDIDMGSDDISAFDLRNTGQIDGCDVNGCRQTFTPPIPTNMTNARGIVLTKDRAGVYVVDGLGHIFAGGTASPINPPTGLPNDADIVRKVKLAPDGSGLYLMDIYGRVWNTSGAPVLTPQYSIHTGEDWARDFELTEDGKGYYLLDKNNGIHAGGNAEALTVNPPPASTSDTGRDIELVDGRSVTIPPPDLSKLPIKTHLPNVLR